MEHFPGHPIYEASVTFKSKPDRELQDNYSCLINIDTKIPNKLNPTKYKKDDIP